MSLRFSLPFIVLLIAGCGQPKDFDDCILQSMKGVDSDLGAEQIYMSCRKKFPEGSEYRGKERALNTLELMNLNGRAGIQFQDVYRGSLYNGNKGITVTSVTISIESKLGEKTDTRHYEIKNELPPLSTRSFSIKILAGDAGSEYSWSITGAKGVR
ncbi:hypothetical protein ACOKWP_004531 [Vibrio parahaemolyticus]